MSRHSHGLVKEVGMSRKRYKPEQINRMLREADVKLSQGRKVGQVCRRPGITDQTYYRWRREFGGMEISGFSVLLS